MPDTGNTTLSESWASLDNTDFPHDEDIQSEVTDTGSLIDTNDSEYVRSVSKEGSGSEFDHSGYTSDNMPEPGYEPYHDGEHPERYDPEPQPAEGEEEFLDHTLVLDQQRESFDGSYMTLYKVIKTFEDLSDSSLSVATTDTQLNHQKLVGAVKMAISRRPTHIESSAFHCIYFGTSSAVHCKADLLGKIGAALLASPDTKSKHKEELYQYHIAPTAYGPGLRPSFTDLIPSQVQMTLADITSLGVSQTDEKDSVIFSFGSDKSFVSRSSQTHFNHDATSQNVVPDFQEPDLFIIQVSDSDMPRERAEIEAALELSQRHAWPTMYVRNESGWVAPHEYPFHGDDVLHMSVELQPLTSPKDVRYQLPVNLNTLLNLDSGQLNAHIGYLQEQANISTQLTSRPSKNFACVRGSTLSPAWSIERVEIARNSDEEQSAKKTPEEDSLSIDQDMCEEFKPGWYSFVRSVLGFSALAWIALFAVAFNLIQLHPSGVLSRNQGSVLSQIPHGIEQVDVTTSLRHPTTMTTALQNVIQAQATVSNTFHGCSASLENGHIICEIFDSPLKAPYKVRVHRDGKEITQLEQKAIKNGIQVGFNPREMHGVVEIEITSKDSTGTKHCGHVDISNQVIALDAEKSPGFLEQYNQVLDAWRHPRRPQAAVLQESQAEKSRIQDRLHQALDKVQGQLRANDQSAYKQLVMHLGGVAQRSRETIEKATVAILEHLATVRQSRDANAARLRELLREQKEILATAQEQARQARKNLKALRKRKRQPPVGRN